MQHVAVAIALGEGGDIARAHGMFARIIDQHCFPRQYHHQFVFFLVPVALRGPGTGIEHDMTGAEIGEPGRRREAAVTASGDFRGEFGGIACRVGLGDGIEIELGHRCALLLADTA